MPGHGLLGQAGHHLVQQQAVAALVGDGDQALARQLGPFHLAAPGPGVAARHGQHIALARERLKAQRWLLAAREAQAEIRLPAQHGLHHLVRALVDDVHLHIGLLHGKGFQYRGQQIGGHRRHAGNRHPATAQLDLVIHALHGLVQAGQGPARLLQEFMAYLGQLHLPRGALQQPHAQHRLQALHAPAQGRRRQEKRFCGQAKTGLLGRGHEGDQLPHVEFDALHATVPPKVAIHRIAAPA